MTSVRKIKSRLNKARLKQLKNKNVDYTSQITEELVDATKDGIIDELRTNEAFKGIGDSFSSILKEFIEGYREGILNELRQIEKETGKSASELFQISEVASIGSSKVSAEDPLQELIDINKESKEQLERLNETLSTPQVPNTPTISSIDLSARIRSSKNYTAPQLSLAQKVGQFGISTLFGAMGLGDFAERKIKQYNERLNFIQIQKKLNPELSIKQIKQNYKDVKKGTKQLNALEDRISSLKQDGYSEDQIRKLGLYDERDTLVKNISSKDERFRPLLQNEEQQLEAQVQLEKNNQLQKDQIDLLEQIKNILLDKNKKTQEQEESSSNISFPIPGAGLIKNIGSIFKKKTGSVINAGKGAFSAAARLGARALPFAIPGAIALAGINAVDWAAGKAGVGDVEIDEEQDNINWQKMSGMEKLESGAARFIEKAGNFLGLDNIAKQARANRIEKETKYFENKEKEAYQLAREKTLEKSENNIYTKNLDSVQSIRQIDNVIEAVEKKTVPTKILVDNIDKSAGEIAKEIGANIKIAVPPPTVIPSPAQTQVMQMPFTYNIKNNETTIMNYIKTRYAN